MRKADITRKTTFIDCQTDILEKFTREEATLLIESLGGRASSSVTKKTNFVVAGSESGSNTQKAIELNIPILTEEEEYRYAKLKEQGDVNAAKMLVTSHLRLVVKIANKYRSYGLSMMDLISEGNIGLMKAVKEFSVDKGYRLTTYAIWWIKASINDYILRSWSLVKMGTSAAQKKLFYNLKRIKARLGLYDNKELTPNEVKTIASELVVDESDVTEMNRRLGGDTSLNVAVGDEDDNEKIDFLVDKSQNIEEKLAAKQETEYRRIILEKCLSELNEREQFIIRKRLLVNEPITLSEAGEILGISRERVRQIEEVALKKLKDKVLLAISEKK
mgnify:CR=1 FL=1